MKKFILVMNGCCWYYFKKKDGWYSKIISGSDARYKCHIVYSLDVADRITKG